jgi:hypothetical protein
MFDVPSSVSRERTICRPSLTRSPSNEGIVVNGNELLLGKTSLTMLPRRAAQSRNLPKQARFSGTTTDRSGFLLLRLPHAIKAIPRIRPTRGCDPRTHFLVGSRNHDKPQRAGHPGHRYKRRLVSHGMELGATSVETLITGARSTRRSRRPVVAYAYF